MQNEFFFHFFIIFIFYCKVPKQWEAISFDKLSSHHFESIKQKSQLTVLILLQTFKEGKVFICFTEKLYNMFVEDLKKNLIKWNKICFRINMSKSMKISVEAEIHGVTCPGVWFSCKIPGWTKSWIKLLTKDSLNLGGFFSSSSIHLLPWISLQN